MSRRTRTGLIVFIAAAAVIAALSLVAYRDTTQPEVVVNTEKVGGIAGELRILHVSDLHATRFGPRQRDIERALDGLRFDAVVITGDLLMWRGGDRQAVFDFVKVLQRHSGAIIYVPGNHDDEALGRQLSARGVVAMGPGSVARLGSGATRATVVYADRWGKVDASVASDTGLLIVAMHQPPDAATRARVARITTGSQVFLAGHTHGGQIRLPLVGAIRAPVRWSLGPLFPGPADEWFPEWQGRQVMGTHTDGRQVVEITPGLGTTGIHVRLFDRAQLTVLRLLPR